MRKAAADGTRERGQGWEEGLREAHPDSAQEASRPESWTLLPAGSLVSSAQTQRRFKEQVRTRTEGIRLKAAAGSTQASEGSA